jgi:hypothetical protein
MHESMSALRNSFAARRIHAVFIGVMILAAFGGGCIGPLSKRKSSCKETCVAGECDEKCECKGTCSEGGKCRCKCGRLKSLYDVPCEKCGGLFHFCAPPDYVGPIDPLPPPRFHPVPTGPVYAHDVGLPE